MRVAWRKARPSGSFSVKTGAPLFEKAIAEGLDLEEDGRQLDAELRGDGGDEAVGRLGVRPEDVEGAATGEELAQESCASGINFASGA